MTLIAITSEFFSLGMSREMKDLILLEYTLKFTYTLNLLPDVTCRL